MAPKVTALRISLRAALLAIGLFLLSGCAVQPDLSQFSPTSTPVPVLAGLGDPLYPRLGNRGYDVQHYTLDLAVDPVQNEIAGTAVMQAEALFNFIMQHPLWLIMGQHVLRISVHFDSGNLA